MNPIICVLLLVICFPVMGQSHIGTGAVISAHNGMFDVACIYNGWLPPHNLKVLRTGVPKLNSGLRDINAEGYGITWLITKLNKIEMGKQYLMTA